MKKLLIFIFFPLLSVAQTDSVKVSFSEEKVDQFEKTTLLDEYDKAFGGNRIVKSAIRFSVQNGLSMNMFPSINYERKLGADKSIIAIISGAEERYSSHFNIGFEPRWYYKMKSKVEVGSQNPNITGKYLSFRFLINPTFDKNIYGELSSIYSLASPTMFRTASTFSVNWGQQFGNNLDFGFSLGVKSGKESYINSKGTWINDNLPPTTFTWFLSTNSKVGLGFYLPRSKQVSNNYCDFLRCNYEVKQLLKININNAIYLDKYKQFLKINSAYERKIGRSPYSLNTDFTISLKNTYQYEQIGVRDSLYQFNNGTYKISKAIFSSNKISSFDYSIGIYEDLRYYLGMKRRIAKGKSASNLNGIYSGLRIGYNISKLKHPIYTDLSIIKSVNNSTTSFIGGILGYQVQTNRKSYLDISVAMGSQTIKSQFKSFDFDTKFSQIVLELNLKLGFAK